MCSQIFRRSFTSRVLCVHIAHSNRERNAKKVETLSHHYLGRAIDFTGGCIRTLFMLYSQINQGPGRCYAQRFGPWFIWLGYDRRHRWQVIPIGWAELYECHAILNAIWKLNWGHLTWFNLILLNPLRIEWLLNFFPVEYVICTFSYLNSIEFAFLCGSRYCSGKCFESLLLILRHCTIDSYFGRFPTFIFFRF